MKITTYTSVRGLLTGCDVADSFSFAELFGVTVFVDFDCLTFLSFFSLLERPGPCCLVLVGRFRMGGSIGGASVDS
jgi:hypothetical protein